MTSFSAFDIIGDVHGHADKLRALLTLMDYQQVQGTWRHPERKAIFVGDYIDGGPQQLEAVEIVCRMVEAEAALAVMGNHEFNAIAWHTPDPEAAGDFLRTHTGASGTKNRHQHARFLAEVEGRAAEHASVIEWFKTLPLWLELPGLRVIHACWNPSNDRAVASEREAGQSCDGRVARLREPKGYGGVRGFRNCAEE